MESYYESVLQIQKIFYERVRLKKQLLELKRRSSVLHSEAIHHQLKLSSNTADQRLLVPTTVDSNLKDTYLDLMNKKSEMHQIVSLSGVSEIKVGVKRVAGFVKEPEPLPPPPKQRKKQRKQETEDTDPEDGIFKLYKTEGTIGDTAYTASFVVKNAPDQKVRKVTELEDLRLGTQSSVAKKMMTQERVTMPETVYSFTSDLYYHKVLYDERQEVLNYVESEMPGVEVTGHTEPVLLQLLSHGQHQVELVWELVWDNSNRRFKYNIVVNCSDDVVTRYSTAEIYPYLSRRQKLKTPQDIIDFIETFTAL